MAYDVDREVQNAKTISGGDEARLKIRAFLDRLLKSAENEAALYVVLCKEKSGTETPVESYGIDFGNDAVETTADEIIEDAEGEAEKSRTKTKYVVRVQEGDKGRIRRGPRDPAARFSLIVTNELEDSPLEEYDGEDPTPKGIVAQMQRHDEKKTALLLTGIKDVNHSYRDMLEDSRAECAALRQECSTLRREAEEVRSMEFMRKMEIAKFEEEKARKEQMMQMMGAGFAMLVEHFTRSAGEKATVAAMKSAFEAMPPDQKNFLYSVLNETQRSAIESAVNGGAPPGGAEGPLGMLGGMLGGAPPAGP